MPGRVIGDISSRLLLGLRLHDGRRGRDLLLQHSGRRAKANGLLLLLVKRQVLLVMLLLDLSTGQL